MGRRRRRKEFDIEEWNPKTGLGRKVKAGEIESLKQILEAGKNVLEPEIVDALLPGLDEDFINVGQAKGKFGGGKRRPMWQTQKKTAEGSKLSFVTLAVVGNKHGYVGLGFGKSAETVPSREKALRKAKKNIIEVVRGCGSWECSCGGIHSLPFAVLGRCGSVRVELMPAPKGTGLAVEDELKKILRLAGYKDVWSRVSGQASKKENLAAACVSALKKGIRMRLTPKQKKRITIGDERE